MKKVAIAFTVLPLVFAGAGYGAGTMLAPSLSETATNSEAAKAKPGEEKHADGYGDAKDAEQDPREDRTIVMLGQVTVPVEKARSISYVVADFALKITDPVIAAEYSDAVTAMRIRDSLLEEMQRTAEGPALRGVAIDSDALSRDLRQSLLAEYPGIEDVLFVSLFKRDIARL